MRTMKTRRTWLTTIVALLFGITASAHDFEVGGIYYNITSAADKTVEVTYKGSTYITFEEKVYTGAITIPSTIIYDDAMYCVTEIGDHAFYYCSGLTSITIPESVTSIDNYAFYYCRGLSSITIPESVISIGESAFSECGFTSITIPAKVKSIGQEAFYYCRNLSSIILQADVPPTISSNTFNSKSIPVYVPKSTVDTYKATAFWSNFTNIQAIEFTLIEGVWYKLITKGCIAEVVNIPGYYSGSVSIPSTVTYEEEKYEVTIGDNAFKNCEALVAVNIFEGVTSIGDYAFYGCSGLASIAIPESVINIGTYTFYDCSSLSSINIPKSVTSIDSYVFCDCSSLTSITIPDGVTSIGWGAFRDCSSLSSINIPKSVTSIKEWAFSYCSSLASITIPTSITSLENHIFEQCSSLTSITIPESVTSIGQYAFSNCSNLTSITIPESVTSIGSNAFEDCSSLTSVVLSKRITKMSNYMFRDCIKLNSINIPESITEFGHQVFYGCKSLTTITIPQNVNYIGSGAFADCPELVDVYCYSRKVPGGGYTNLFDNSYPKHATLHVPATVLEIFKTTAPWSSFGKFEILEFVVTDIALNQTSVILTEGKDLALTATIAPDDATDKGVSWTSSNTSVAVVNAEGRVTAIAPGIAIITAIANDGSGVSASCEVTVVPASYVITFLVDGEVFATDTLTRGAPIDVPASPSKEGYTFSGWGEVPETMPAHDVTISATFITNKYLVTFMADGVVIVSDSLEYGSAITVPTMPEREGYTFSGWGEVAETVPAHDVTYEACYVVNVYRVFYFVGTKLVHTADVAYGEAIPEYVYEPTEEGDVFVGWIGESYDTMPAHDVTYTANITNDVLQWTIDNGQLTIYDLSGRKVTDAENLKGGIYIVNGKKVVINNK